MRRRHFLKSATGAAILDLGAAFSRSTIAAPLLSVGEPQRPLQARKLYADLLQSWCDGLLFHQVANTGDQALDGGLLCPSCALIHGRCADAVYPLIYTAHKTGDEKYLRAAVRIYDWTERQVSQTDGSWINDVVLNPWQGITVFRTIALAETLRHHGDVLDAATRQRWTNRLAKAVAFLDGFITISVSNINYPITSTYAFALCGQVLGNEHYTQRARDLAQSALEYFTPGHLIFGEGHPQTAVSRKGCRPVDLGYNVEESLPALALYSLLVNDEQVRSKVVDALRSHLEFMLPDGSWDNSWGTRNFKWSWWGSRTSDGCHPAFVALSKYDPRFAEAALRNVQLMADCTKNNLLYGGPDYSLHGDYPCIHHTFTHAKALTTVLDGDPANLEPAEAVKLPRDMPYGMRTYPEVGTYLLSMDNWRATVTEYDFEYIEGSRGSGTELGIGGHATGGALTMLFHQTLGPVCVASMTRYQALEISNQQAVRGNDSMPLTPRIECSTTEQYSSLNDLEAKLTGTHTALRVSVSARGRLLTTTHVAPPSGDVQYQLEYVIEGGIVSIHAQVSADALPAAPIHFMLPIVSRPGERVEQKGSQKLLIHKPNGVLTVTTDASEGFGAVSSNRVFNLVPGFLCLPISIPMIPGHKITIQIEA